MISINTFHDQICATVTGLEHSNPKIEIPWSAGPVQPQRGAAWHGIVLSAGKRVGERRTRHRQFVLILVQSFR